MHKKLILSIFILGLSTLVISNRVSAAQENENPFSPLTYEETIYNYFLNDFILTTGREKEEADLMFKERNTFEFNQDEVEKLVYGKIVQKDYEEIVFEIQFNYSDIVTPLNEDEKYIIDQYYLSSVMRYYIDYGDPTDFIPTVLTEEHYITFDPEPATIDNEEFYTIFGDEDQPFMEEEPIAFSPEARADKLAEVRVFSDGSGRSSGSSGLEAGLGTHSWISVSNISSLQYILASSMLGQEKQLQSVLDLLY